VQARYRNKKIRMEGKPQKRT